MSYLKTGDKSVGYLIGAAAGVILVAILLACFQAWLLGIVLGWFGVALSFWQNFVIVILVSSLFGSSRTSN